MGRHGFAFLRGARVGAIHGDIYCTGDGLRKLVFRRSCGASPCYSFLVDIRIEVNAKYPTATQILELFEVSGILPPQWTPERMDRALQGSAVVVCAWSGDELVGFARAISDLAWVAYLTQL